MKQQCVVCDNEISFRWTDTHGVGACYECGMPYTIYHYEGDKRVEKAPEPAIKAEFIPIGKRYWDETKRRCFPGAYDMGILSRRGTTYSVATESDMHAWDNWCEAHKDELPKPEELAITQEPADVSGSMCTTSA